MRRSRVETTRHSVKRCRFTISDPNLTTTRFKELRLPEDKIKNERIIYTSHHFNSRIIVFLSALPSFYTIFLRNFEKERYIISNWWNSPTQAIQGQEILGCIDADLFTRKNLVAKSPILVVLEQPFYRAYSKPKPYRSFFEHKQSHTRLFFSLCKYDAKKLIPPIANSPFILFFSQIIISQYKGALYCKGWTVSSVCLSEYCCFTQIIELCTIYAVLFIFMMSRTIDYVICY